MANQADLTCRYCQRPFKAFLHALHEKNCSQNPANDVPTGQERPSETAMREAFAPTHESVVDQQVVDTANKMAEADWHQEPTPVTYVIAETPDGQVTGVEIEEPVVNVAAPAANGTYFPTHNRSFLIQDSMVKFLERVHRQSQKHPINVLLIGNQGAGKTSLAIQFAAKYKRPCYIAPCVTMTEPVQWWGNMAVSPERGTFYIPSAFVKSIETEDCVIILDDMNRVENPKVLNPLFPLLDDRRETHLDDLGRSVRVAKGVVIFATVNEGFQFQGTDPIDLALRDRFDQVPVGYPPSTSIAQILQERSGLDHINCQLIAEFAGNLAGHPSNPIVLSMRQLIRMAEHMADGASAREAVDFTLMASFKPKDMEIVKLALQQLLKADYTATVSGWRRWGNPDGD